VTPADRADAAVPLGGPLQFTMSDLHEIVAALDVADADLIGGSELRDASLESDPFLAVEGYGRAVERMMKELWTHLAFYDPECDRAEVDESEPW
jgi:hypothetical protein